MGAGVVLECGAHRREWGVPLPFKGTNNVAELMAIKIGLLSLKDRASCDVTLWCDSSWAIGAITQPWMLKFNTELVAEIRTLIAECGRFNVLQVKGHADCSLNNRADELATAARREALDDAANKEV